MIPCVCMQRRNAVYQASPESRAEQSRASKKMSAGNHRHKHKHKHNKDQNDKQATIIINHRHDRQVSKKKKKKKEQIKQKQAQEQDKHKKKGLISSGYNFHQPVCLGPANSVTQ